MEIEEFATLYTEENAPDLPKSHKTKNLPSNFFETITESAAVCVKINWKKLGHKSAELAYGSFRRITIKRNVPWVPHRYRDNLYLIRRGSEING